MANDQTNNALTGLGVPAATASDTISNFNLQNLSPQDIFSTAASLPQTVGGIPGVGSSIPGLGKIPLPSSAIPNILALPNQLRLGVGGSFNPVNYATDLNYHHPKLKFLFKVGFYGFAAQNFYYFVQRCDRPKVRLNHTEVNYYNFRSRVLTSVTYEPLAMTFLDEIGNSVNAFFTSYMQSMSGNASGSYGIDRGFGASSSSFPYPNGYSSGKLIIIEQIFANGTLSNRFIFTNPRIESFELDELDMDENAGSMANIQFSYDAIEMQTLAGSRLYGWGANDLLNGNRNAGSLDPISGLLSAASSALGLNVGGAGGLPKQPDIAFAQLQSGQNMLNAVPASLSDLVPSTSIIASAKNFIGSGSDIVSQNIQSTIDSIKNGTNMQFGGSSSPAIDQVYDFG